MSATNSQLDRNKAIVRSFKESQGTKDQDATMREIMSPDYKRTRGGLINLADNAAGQGWPEPGLFLRTALPDRVDKIEDIAAEGEYVAMMWRLNATHTGNLFGIPPTGRTIDIYEVGFFRVVDGKIVEGWFMCDELALLIQLERPMPKRKDGSIVAPHVSDEGDAPDARMARFTSQGAGAGLPTQLRDYAERSGVAQQDLAHALTDRSDRVARVVTEGDKVWSRFNLRGTNTQSFYGLPPTGKRCVIAEVGIARAAGEDWAEPWYLADGLGALLQLGALGILEKLGCKPV